MSVIPAGILSLTQENLRIALAACATFRTLCGAADQAEALAKIHHDGLPDPANGAAEHTISELEALRPYAIVYTAEEQGLQTRALATGGSFNATTNLCLQLVRSVTAEVGDAPDSDANMQWLNTVGKIIDELWALNADAGYLQFADITLARGPTWASREEIPAKGLTQIAELTVQVRQ